MAEFLILLVFVGPGLIIMASGHPLLGVFMVITSPLTVLSGPFGSVGLWVLAILLYLTKPS